MERYPDAEPSPSPESVGAESEPLRESASNVQELLDAWHIEYEQADDDRKQELAYRIIKLGEAVTFAGLTADQVHIREAEPGVLGFYVPDSGEIAMTPAGLELPPEHFRDVLVHEATHAGITTGKEIADEGLTQVVTRTKVAGAMHGIYETEQRDTQATFDTVGVRHVIDRYDFERPAELIDLYLQTEWAEAWAEEWAAEVGPEAITTTTGRRALIEGPAREWVERLEEALEQAAPRLVDKAKHEGFDFSAAHQSILERLSAETLEQAA